MGAVRLAPPVKEREGADNPVAAVGGRRTARRAGGNAAKEKGGTAALAEALATALPLRLPLPLLDALLQPGLLTNDDALPDAVLLLRVFLNPDGLVDA